MKAVAKAVLVVAVVALACRPRAEPVDVREEPKSAEGLSTNSERAIDWYPLVKGATWEYEVTKESVIHTGSQERKTAKPGNATDVCLGPSQDDRAIQLLQRRIVERNPRLAEPTVSTTVQRVRIRDTSIDALSVQQDGQGADSVGVGPLFSLGVSRQRLRQVIDGLVLDTAQVSQLTEGVTVPAGAYPDALKRVLSGTISGRLGPAPVERGTVKESTWFARGVGPVKVERSWEFGVELDSGPAVVTEVMVRSLVKFSVREEPPP